MTAARNLTPDETIAWLQLTRSEGVGPRTFRGLLDRFGTASQALAELPGLVRRKLGGRAIAICPRADAEREWHDSKAKGIDFLASCEPDYPEALRATDAAPPLLAIKGRRALLTRPAVAVVGSRNASGPGQIFTERLARGIGTAGYVVVSGLARGIDVKAHLASLDTGTVAVLAGGHDRIYPSEHVELALRIGEQGLLVSEMPLTWEPRARDFPRRNRIVSGLALGVVVVEASRRSGSLITARFATEQGREVFAVPGSPLDARAEGTIDLLRQGATICAGADDVIAALAPLRSDTDRFGELVPDLPEREPLWEELDLFGLTATAAASGRERSFEDAEAPSPQSVTEADRVLALLGPVPIGIDDLVRLTGLASRTIRANLLELELQGRLHRHDGDRVSRVPV